MKSILKLPFFPDIKEFQKPLLITDYLAKRINESTSKLKLLMLYRPAALLSHLSQ